MKIKSLVMGVALMAATAGTAAAQTSIYSSFTVNAGHQVEYTPFYVTQAGFFNFQTYSNTDPSIYLFAGAQSSAVITGAQLAYNDDYPWCCESYFGLNLGVGGYTVATSRYYFDSTEARNGYNASASYGDNNITLGITSANGQAYLDGNTVTPEPVSMTLLGTGLLGVAAKRRRRKSAEAVA